MIGLAIGAVIASFISFRIGYNRRKIDAEAEIGSAEQESRRIINEALKTAESKKREALLEAKEEVHRSRIELDREIKERRSEIQRQERRLVQKEETLDKKVEAIEQKDELLNRKLKEIQVTQEKTAELHRQQLEELERISGLSIEEAKQYLLRNVENEVRHEMAVLVKELEARQGRGRD